MSDAVFTVDADGGLTPTEHARGPWDPGSMHGGGPAALVARAIERLETPVLMRCVRLSFEFASAVPMERVEVSASLARTGRRLALADAVVTTGEGREVLRARATLLRRGEVHLPDAPVEAPVPGPETGTPGQWTGAGEPTGFHRTAMELRFARGDWGVGPALAWFRLRMPVVEGEQPTPLQRVVAAADFGNGVSRALEFGQHLFVNTDLSVHLHREPDGEWVGLAARTDLSTAGLGQAVSILHDEHGRLGAAAQSLFVDER